MMLAGIGHDAPEGIAHLALIMQSQLDTSGIRLVQNIRRSNLHHNRKSDSSSRINRRIDLCNLSSGYTGDTRLGKNSQTIMFRVICIVLEHGLRLHTTQPWSGRVHSLTESAQSSRRFNRGRWIFVYEITIGLEITPGIRSTYGGMQQDAVRMILFEFLKSRTELRRQLRGEWQHG